MPQSGLVQLKVTKCDKTGETGFEIHGQRNTNGMFVGTTGILVAHDLIEHVNGIEMIGGLGDELMALGGIWETRGQWGDMWRGKYANKLSSEKNIAGELPELYRVFLQGVPFRIEIPPYIKDYEELYEFWDDSIAEEGIKMTRGDWSEDEFDLDKWVEFVEAGRYFFVAGAKKLNDIWETATLQANNQFWAIHDEVEDALTRDIWEDQLYHLAYGSGAASIVPIE